MKLFHNKRNQWMGLGMLVLAGLSSNALACPGGQGGQGGQGGPMGQGGRMGPPPEAMAACSGTGENQACQFEAPHGTVTGTCRSIQNQMACVPQVGPPGGPGGQGGME